ncbi:MAG: helix-turn-helix domain-containing protein [Candidatus Dormibacteria bacterium]|jgi:excisionase family DNA binding protein
MDSENSRPLLTLSDAAKRLGISTRHLARLLAPGDLPVVRLSPRVVRIAPADLDAYVESRKGR